MPPCPFPQLTHLVVWDTKVGEDTGRTPAGATVEWTGGEHDAALQPPRLLPSSPPHPCTIMHTPELPCPSHPFPLLRHWAVWDATVEENTWRTRMGGQDQVGRGRDTAAIQLPRLLLLSPPSPPHNHGLTQGTAFPLPTTRPTHPRPHPFLLSFPSHSRRSEVLQWGKCGRIRKGWGTNWMCE